MRLLREKLLLLTGFEVERFGARSGNTGLLLGVGSQTKSGRDRRVKEDRAHKEENSDPYHYS
jgi:hypothetical protein